MARAHRGDPRDADRSGVSSRRLRAAVLCLLVACGDNFVTPDAFVADAIDAAPDTPPPPAGCDWAELFDADNHTTPEPTALGFTSQLVMCGRVDPGHTVTTTMLVDADAFGFSLFAPGAIRVELVGNFGALGVELSIVNRFGDPLTTSRFVGAHAITAATLPAGRYGVAVRAIGAEPGAPIDYTATITADTTSCLPPGTSDFTETNAPNDVVEVRYTGDPALRRVLTSGNPANTGIVAGPAARITGTSADVDAPDDFRDRDTFAITTGNVDTLTVRVDWTAPAVDLDLLVFPAALPEIAGATHVATVGPETATFAVAPSTTYWIWIGSYDTSTGLPSSYDVSICAE